MFSLCREWGKARMGRLTSQRGSIPTPAMLLSLRQGDLHALTQAELSAFGQPYGVVLNPFDFMSERVMQNLGGEKGTKGAKFFGVDAPVTLCLPKDVVESEFLPGNNDKGVSVALRMGRRQISPKAYSEVVHSIQPDIACSLWDEVCKPVKEKRTQTAVYRTAKWLEGATDAGGCPLWAPVLGGDWCELRSLSAEKTAVQQPEGYVLCNFGRGDREADLGHLLDVTLPPLDPTKPRFMPGILTPEEMWQAIQMGIDLFDSSFVWDLCTKGQALVGSLPHTPLDMMDPTFKRDGGALFEGCPCYCCRHHSRAYVHHLLCEGEILGQVLLQLHNLQWMFSFFDRIRLYIKERPLQELNVKGGSHILLFS